MEAARVKWSNQNWKDDARSRATTVSIPSIGAEHRLAYNGRAAIDRTTENREERRKMAIATINPATGKVEKTFEPLSDAQIEVKLQTAADTFGTYLHGPFGERAHMMLKAAEI